MTAKPRLSAAPATSLAGVRRRTVIASAMVAVPGLGSAPAAAAAFPDRAVRIVVPYSVGVGPDVVARSVAERLARRWSQPVLIDNKPGASGIIAFSEVRRTPADGHTLFLADTATLAVNPLLHATLPYDPVHDLIPLTLLFRATFLLWVGGESRFTGVPALLDAARRAPESVSYASLGNGHASHVAIETFARAADVRMLHVPFKDVGAMLSAVASGDVDFTAIGMNTASGLMAGGKLRPIAVASKRRLADHADIPTLAEAGGPAVEMHPWAALVAITGTAPAVVDQLRRDIGLALDAAEVRAGAESAGFEITPSTPQALNERIEADIALYAPLIREGRVARL
jgi:tripartite-type tricarboxylate transporter receptor subunit TctC